MEQPNFWEEETIARMKHAKEQQLKTEQEAAYWKELADALEKTVTLIQRQNGQKANGYSTRDEGDIRQKSCREALHEIAKANDGLLVTTEAAKILIDAGMFQDGEQARNNIFTTLHHDKKSFRKEKPGHYRLVTSIDV